MVFNILSIKITISWSTISTIREHIAAEEALAGACEAVGVYEAADVGIVITALQVIEPRLCGVVLSNEAARIKLEASS